MADLVGIFVHHPLRILALGAAFLAFWALLRARRPDASRRIHALLAPAIFCVAFAVWEWLVMTRSPEANIRIDLLLIWPVLLLLGACSIYLALRR